METPSRFRVIKGGARPRAYRARKRGEAEQITCPTCEREIGVSSNATIEVRLGRRIRSGRPEGGTKAIVCVGCIARGTVTVLVP